MKYFMDFEAEQPSGFIREIGCIREDGKEFFSHVNTRKQATAPQIEEVCEKFISFLKEDKKLGCSQFYFWSNADLNYLHNTAFILSDLLSKVTLGLIMSSYFDYASWFANKYKINVRPSLEKISKVFDLCQIQTHNALDDAKLLKDLYETEIEMNSFDFIYRLISIYGKEIVKGVEKEEGNPKMMLSFSQKIISTNTKTNEEKIYDGIEDIITNLLAKFDKQQRTTKNKDTLTKQLIEAIENNKTFYECKWRIIP